MDKRFIVDTCGSLMDMSTRNCYDYVSDVVGLLNELNDENKQLKSENKGLQGKASSWKITASEQIMEQSKLMKENVQLRKENRKLKEDLEHCANQFTNDGKNVLLSLR